MKKQAKKVRRTNLQILRVSRDNLQNIRELAQKTGLTERQIFDDLLLIGFRASDQIYGQLIEFRKELHALRTTPEVPLDGGSHPPEAEPIEEFIDQPGSDEPDEEPLSLGVSDDETGHYVRPEPDNERSGLYEDVEVDHLSSVEDRGPE